MALLPAAIEDYVAEDAPSSGDRRLCGWSGCEGSRVWPVGAGSYGATSLRSAGSAEALRLRLFERGAVVAAVGARMPTQPRSDVAFAPACARLQDDCGLSPRQQRSDCWDLSDFRAVLSCTGLVHGTAGSARRLEVPRRGKRQARYRSARDCGRGW